MDAHAALILLALLEAKHLVADYCLQTAAMLADRGRYLHAGRACHCLLHAAGSGIALIATGVPPGSVAVVLAAEWLAHYHIDFGKGVWSDRTGHGPGDASFWRAFGTDQFLHHLTYLAMVWVVV